MNSREARVLDELRPGRDRQSLVVPFQETRIPTVQRQVELFLHRAQQVGGRYVQHPANAQHPYCFAQASFPVGDVLEQLGQDANIERCVLIGQRGGRGDIETDGQPTRLGSLAGDLDQGLRDVGAADRVPIFRPKRGVRTRTAADIGDAQLSRPGTKPFEQNLDAILDALGSTARSFRCAFALVVLHETGIGVGSGSSRAGTTFGDRLIACIH